jgi:hypothetical protein
MIFGILCNGNDFQKWQIDTIRHLVEGGHVCKLLIVNANPAYVQGFREKLVHYPYSKFLYRVWFRYMMKPDAKRSVSINEIHSDLPQISCKTSKKGFSEYFGLNDIANIKSYGLDFILRFGFGIIRGDILESAKYGVWSYHHGDDRKFRGAPTGFWEIMFGDPVNAAVLQRLTDKLDSGIILHKAYFSTIGHSWQANIDNLFQKSALWPLQVCKRIELGQSEFLALSNPPVSPVYRLPDNFRMFRFLIKVLSNKLRFHFRDLFLTEKWNVGIIRMPIEKLIQPGSHEIPEPEWLTLSNEKSVYHADSFGFISDDISYILCEEYDYKTTKGIIVSFEINKQTNKICNKNTALEKEYHLAYPYLFEFEKQYYCVPENTIGGNIDLYRFDVKKGKLIFVKTLIENIRAVDPTLFFYQGLWWLFFTDKISTNERLHIWYSASLYGPFNEHANNPVKEDIRSARPAGSPFFMDGKLFRPAQDCAVRSGRRIRVNLVTKLSETEFEEEEYSILNPALNSKYSYGMHTLSVANGLVIA